MAELYFGYAVNTATATQGTTPGFTYGVDSSGDGIAYSTDVTTSAAPAWGDSGQALGLMVLISEQAAAQAVTAPAMNSPAAVSRVITIPVRIG